MTNPNIVLINNPNLDGGFGTGFFISEDIILTCCHCVYKLDNEVKVRHNRSNLDSKILAKDEDLDLALLQTLKKVVITPPIFTEEFSLKEEVHANGFNRNLGIPFNELGAPLPQKGVIKGFDTTFGYIVVEDSIIFNGYSGSPLIKENNAIIGVIRLSDYKAKNISGDSVAISAEKIRIFCEANNIILDYQKKFLTTCNENLESYLKNKISSFDYFERNIKGANGSKLSFKDFADEVKKNKLNIISGIGGIGKSRLLCNLSLDFLSKNPESSFTLYCDCKVWDSETKINYGDLKDRIDNFNIGFKKSKHFTKKKIIEIANREDIEKYIFIDGLNEIADHNTRTELLDFLKKIVSEYNFVVCIATRNIMLNKQTVWNLYETDGIDSQTLTNILKQEFNKEEEDYSTKNFEFLKLPFFLDIAIKSKNDVIKSYSDFINTHVFKGIEDNISEIQDFLCEKTFAAYQSPQRFLIPESEEINKKIIDLNIQNIILIKTEVGYKLEHQLINEYFVAQYISKKPAFWNKDIFHLITFENRISFQVIQMILEQIGSKEEGDEFLKKLYNWNFYAVLHCLKNVENKYTDQFARFLLLILSEKLFDNFKHSRVKVNIFLSPRNEVSLFEQFKINALDKDIIDKLLKFDCSKETKTKILKDVIDQNSVHFLKGTFKKHFELFSTLKSELSEDIINIILNEDSLMGWCCANVIRRANYSYCNELQLRTLYISSKNDIIHWRIVHSLGKAKTIESVNFLLEVIKNNEYIWATYGAIRSLMEIALFNDMNSFQDHIFQQLMEILENKKYETYVIEELGYCLQNKISQNKHKSVQQLFDRILHSSKENFVNSTDLWHESFNIFKIYNGIK